MKIKMNFSAAKVITGAVAVFGLACAAALSFSACSKKSAGGMMQKSDSFAVYDDEMVFESASYEAPMAAPRVMKAAKEVMVTNSAVADMAFEKNSGATNIDMNSNVNISQQRKLIYNGDVNLLVNDLEETEQKIAAWVESYGGYITNSSINNNNMNVTARIPAKFFDQAMEGTAEFGKTEHRSVYTEDVTDQFYDLSTRLETRKILRERLQTYLKEAASVKDMISIEKELNNVQSDIESMEGQFKRLNNRIDFATITIYGHLQVNQTQIGYRYPDLGKKFRQLWADVLNFFADFLVGIFYFVIYAIPILAAIWLLYFICFGRIGLVKKLFAVAGSKAKKSDKIEKSENSGEGQQ